jgi:hypothetical protein
MKVCHRVCGDRHGDTATTVELFDEGVALRIPAMEVVDDAYGRFVVDVNVTGTSPLGRGSVVVIVGFLSYRLVNHRKCAPAQLGGS